MTERDPVADLFVSAAAELKTLFALIEDEADRDQAAMIVGRLVGEAYKYGLNARVDT